jgi:hypothetical protein
MKTSVFALSLVSSFSYAGEYETTIGQAINTEVF